MKSSTAAIMIVMPGLVNTHTHMPMTLLRAMADDLRLDVWLMGYMMPVEREFVDPEFCRLGTELSCAEMIRGGTTLFADMYYFEADIAAATAQAGLRGVCGQSVMKFPAPDAQSYEESLAYTRHFIEEWKDHPLIVPSVAPHAPYTCTDEILQACADLAVEFDVPLQIHILETRQEAEDSWQEFEKKVVNRVTDLGVFRAKSIAAHCVHVDSEQIRLLQKHRCCGGAQSDQQPQTGERDRAGQGDARTRRTSEHWHGWRGQQQRPGHVRRDAAGGAAGQGRDVRPGGAACAGCAVDGDALGRRGAAPGRRSPAAWRWANAPT